MDEVKRYSFHAESQIDLSAEAKAEEDSLGHWVMFSHHVRFVRELEAEIEKLRAVLTATQQPQGMPEGWVLVPINCTLSMIVAGKQGLSDNGVYRPIFQDAQSCWGAMLAAAPSPEAQS
jgi:hypothetical protein